MRRALDKDIQTAGQVKGLDVLITGHAHVGTPEPIKVGNTLILSTDSGGIDVGKLVLDYQEKPHQFTVKHFELKTLYAMNGSLIRRQNRSSTAGISNLINWCSRSLHNRPLN